MLRGELAKAVREKEECRQQMTLLRQEMSELKDNNDVCIVFVLSHVKSRLGRRMYSKPKALL